MADIRISALPNEAAPSGADFVAIDLATTRKTTVTLLTEAGRPAASQAEAEAGTNPTKAMTPLTTAQAIAFQVGASFVPQARTVTAGVGLDGGGALTGDITLDVNFTQVQAFSTKLSNFDGTTLSSGGLIFGAGVDTFSVLPIGSNNQVLQIIAGNPTWTNVAAGGDVVGPASSVTGTIPTYNGATGKLIQAGNPVLADMLTAQRGPMSTISNNTTDATNDIDFSAGSAFSEDATHWPMIGAALTKQLDAAWAVGNNAGGRMSAAAIANTTYHCYQIRRPDTGVVDYGFDVSATAPTLPTNYTQYRRIGAILRESGVIVQFSQTDDIFLRANNQFYSSTSARALAVITMPVPLGITVYPIFVNLMVQGTVGDVASQFSSGLKSTIPFNANFTALAGERSSAVIDNVPTNTSAQINFAVIIGSGTLGSLTLTAVGWKDTRGK